MRTSFPFENPHAIDDARDLGLQPLKQFAALALLRSTACVRISRFRATDAAYNRWVFGPSP